MVNILACSISGWLISVSHQFAMASLLSLVIIDLLLLMWIFRRDGPSQEPVRDWLWSRLSLNNLSSTFVSFFRLRFSKFKSTQTCFKKSMKSPKKHWSTARLSVESFIFPYVIQSLCSIFLGLFCALTSFCQFVWGGKILLMESKSSVLSCWAYTLGF